MKNLLFKTLLCLFLPFFIAFLNWDLVEDRFVAPVQDLETQIQAWDWEVSSEISAASQKPKTSIQEQILVPFFNEHSNLPTLIHWNQGRETSGILEISIFTFFFNLPPPSLA